MIHIYRQIINNDEKFRNILREMNLKYYHKNVSSAEVEDFLDNYSKADLTSFFDQYLRTTKIPILEYKTKDNTLKFRFKNIVKGFQIPVKVYINGKENWIQPNKNWQSFASKENLISFKVDPNFYLKSSKLK